MKNKRLLSLLLSTALLLSACPVGLFGITASAATTSGTTGECEWRLDDTVLTISGNGSMGNYDYYYSTPWWETSITEIIINNGVTNISDFAFCNCTGLTSVVIPDSVTSIGGFAFDGCSGLTSITIPDSVTSIRSFAFRGCSNLKYNIYDNGKYLGNESNKYLALIDTTDTDITDFKFADGVKLIYGHAFYDCTGLTSIIIPNSVTSIGYHAFQNCRGLTSVTIPNSVTSIYDFAFYSCTGLKELTFKAQTVPKCAFGNCSNLKKIYFSKNLTKIFSSAFSSAKNITDIYYEGTEEEWEKVVNKTDNGALKTATVHYNSTGIPSAGSMTITSMPEKLFYGPGEALDVTGGKIKFVYDDGSEELIDITANMISGYDSEKYGKQEITVTYKECTAKFTAEIYKTGDIDGDERIGASDITQLRKCLLSVITGNAKFDVNGDGETDIRDLVRIKKLATG